MGKVEEFMGVSKIDKYVHAKPISINHSTQQCNSRAPAYFVMRTVKNGLILIQLHNLVLAAS